MTGIESPRFEVRVAELDEAVVVAGVLRAAFAEFEGLYTPAAFAATVVTPEQIAARWAEGSTWVAVRGGAVVGTVGAVPTARGVYVRSMAVMPEAAGLGIGRRLLEAVEALAREHGSARLYLSTTPYLTRAIRLYEQFGFVRTGEGPHNLLGTPLFTMEKRLAAGRLDR